MSATLVVRFEIPGTHHWPRPEACRKYGLGCAHEHLHHTHRHLFYFEVELQSSVDDERSIEFHELMAEAKAKVKTIVKTIGTDAVDMIDFGSSSCESIAGQIAQLLADSYARRVVVSCFEDGECGAIVAAVPNVARLEFESDHVRELQDRPRGPRVPFGRRDRI